MPLFPFTTCSIGSFILRSHFSISNFSFLGTHSLGGMICLKQKVKVFYKHRMQLNKTRSNLVVEISLYITFATPPLFAPMLSIFLRYWLKSLNSSHVGRSTMIVGTFALDPGYVQLQSSSGPTCRDILYITCF